MTRLAITAGDPAGIGPEVTVKLLAALRDDPRRASLVVLGHAGSLRRAAEECELSWSELGLVTAADSEDPTLVEPETVAAIDLADLPLGQVSAAAGEVAAACVDGGIDWALSERVGGVLTAPIHKEAIHRAGCQWPGHTERLAERAGRDTIMCMTGGGIVCAFATTHVALRDVPWLADEAAIVSAGELLWQALPGLTVSTAPIGVLGLNPHASDGGRFGDEEARIVAPAIARLRAAGVPAEGPLVPDAAFRQHRQGRYAALVALYHDQGNIVLKTVGFDEGVNITLGLPFVRTSPDHGTAFDIAGRGIATVHSMRAAFETAWRMIQARQANEPDARREHQ